MLIFLVLTAVFWGVAGTITTKVRGRGILIGSGALSSVVSLGEGQIERIFVDVDKEIEAGQVVATISQPALQVELAEAQRQLGLLYKKRDTAEGLDKQIDLLRSRHIDEQKKNLLQSISSLEQRAEVLKKIVQRYKQLLDKDFMTLKEFLLLQQEQQQIQEEISTKRAMLTDLSASKADVSSRRQKELINLDIQILEVEEEIKTLRERMTLTSKITSPYNGRVTELFKIPGMTISLGEPLLTLEQSGDNDALHLVAYFPPYQGKKIQVGMSLGVTPSVVRAEEYGHILGEVTYVSSFPSSSEGMLKILRNKELVNRLATGGAPIMIKADLAQDPETPSGVRWSSGQGPEMNIRSGTLCDVNVMVAKEPPATLVIPFFKRTLLGVGEKRPEHRE